MTTDRPLSPRTGRSRGSRPRLRRLGAAGTGLLLAVGLTGGLAACDDDDSSSPTTTTAGATPTTAAASHTVSADACDAFAQFSSLVFQMPEDPSDFAGFFSEQMVPTVTTIVEGLPADHAAPGETVLEAYTAIAETGNPEGMEDPAVAEAQTELGKVLHEGCDGTRLEVEGVDYGFEGLPEEIDAGRVSIAFTDTGAEEHEIMIMKLHDGEDLTLDELLALPQEEAFAHVVPIAVAWGAPGETSYTAAELEPGTYFALCNIPIGGGEEGAPHHTAGMKQTFTVT